jgi:hypothetical protein
MGFQRFERRLERLVEGTFSKAFRSGLQPVEIGRRVVRETDAGRTLGVRGTVVPNHFTVELSAEDIERFSGFADALTQELAATVREHAREERYFFEGPVEVELVLNERARRGDLRVRAEIVGGAIPAIGSVVLPDGKRVALGESTAVIGRMPECAITLSDAQASRQHAEIRHNETGYRIVDLGSTNGTEVNGVKITEMPLSDGDEIVIGATSLRFEES